MTTIVAGIDIESTGLDFLAGHKIIEIAITRYELETQRHIDSLEMRFNPRRNIDPKAQAVHGISLEQLAAEPLLSNHASEIGAYMGHVVCGLLITAKHLIYHLFDTSFQGME
ncbi:hypothetical protein AE37_05034 [Escherichia coli BIDMC 62]|nr:hypothetical protein L456_05139 [Escherichia coli BIDMC 20B]KDF66383.1 hypothetical protein AE33_05013 [Escherichia coli BIDMC 58]KDF78799.1 hypothetical protein AE37_05034 [Escherichia coli BIDMC 62]